MLRNTLARFAIAVPAFLALIGFLPAFAYADTVSVNFESYTSGIIHSQDGWTSTGAAGLGCAVYDHAVDSSFSTPGFGARSLRISDAVTSGCFDSTFSKSLVNEAGETDALNGGMSGGVRQPHFEAQFDLASVLPQTQQVGMHVSVSPDRGDGARMSYLRFEDNANGVDVFFDDVQGTVANGVDDCTASACANFVETNIATLDRSVPHTIKFSMDFVEGPSNDIVKVYIDGVLKATGTSWEDYYRFDPESNPSLVSNSRTVDSLIFRTSGTATPADAGKGFLIDNLSLTSGPIPAPECNANASQTVVSDASTIVDSHHASLLSFIHTAWDAVISGASWIWSENPVADTTVDTTKVFTHDFTIVGTPLGANLMIASDNSYEVSVNGNPVGADADGNNFQLGTQDVIAIPAVDLHSGTNTLTISVKNFATPNDTNPQNNPAGLMYKLTVTNNECVTPPTIGTITVTKVVVGNANFTPANFPLFIGDTQVVSGASNTLTAGTYEIHETGNPDFVQTFSGDCSLDATDLDRLNKIHDFQEKKAALQNVIVNSPLDPLNPSREALIQDIDTKVEALQATINGHITLGVNQNAQCTITNTYIPPVVAACPADTHPVLVETKTVNSASSNPVQSLTSLANGQAYLLTASGTWQNSLNAADTEYASVDSWATHMDGYNIDPYMLGAGEFDLMVNGLFASWGAYNPAHAYTIQYTGTGAPVGLMVFDGDSTVANPTPNTGWYGDNSGNLDVAIYKCVSNFGSLKIEKNTLGGDGTFSFTGVGNGTTAITTVGGAGSATVTGLVAGAYTATEAAQAGWNLTSNTCANVLVVAGEVATCKVTNTKQASISGMKYNDLNRNGKKDANEPGLSGWKIRLYVQGRNGAYTVLTTTTTDANGNYTFSNVAPGKYKVREVNQKGWKRMSKNPKPIALVVGADITSVNFGNAQKKQQEREDTEEDCNRDDQGGEHATRSGRSAYND